MATEYCRHIRPNGTRCNSYALTGQLRCYWHTGLQQRHLALAPSGVQLDPATQPPPFELDFPELEDRASIQLALSMLLGALARNRIDPKRAGPILYGLQVASSNVRDLHNQQEHIVRTSSLDDHGQPLAPDEDPEEITETQLFIEDFENELRKEEEDDTYEGKYYEEE
jgi:hypothetical protein